MKIKLIFLLSLLMFSELIYSQNLNMAVTQTDGSVDYFAISDINKLTFPVILQKTNLFVSLDNSSYSAYPILNVSKITFDTLLITNVKQEQKNPESFSIINTYPNPATNSVSIEYETPTQGTVNISIFDIYGNLIRTFEMNTTGKHTINWDCTGDSGSAVVSGVYNCVINFKNQTSSKRIIVVK